MLTVKLEGLAEVRAQLREFSDRRFRASVATSLTRAARETRDNWQDQITNRIDRPVARTQSATTFVSANANSLEAATVVKDQLAGTPPATYLNPHERSGGRRVKLFEAALQAAGAMPRGYITVPGRGAQLDAYGNVSRSQIISVITALGTEYSPGYARVIPRTVAGRLAAMARRGKSYIAVLPGEDAARKVSPGVYQRGPGGSLAAVFLFKRAVTYRKRLDLERDAIKEAPQLIADEFQRAVAESFARLAARTAG